MSAFLGVGLSAEVYRVANVRFEQEGALKLLVDGARGLRERFITESDALRFLRISALPRRGPMTSGPSTSASSRRTRRPPCST